MDTMANGIVMTPGLDGHTSNSSTSHNSTSTVAQPSHADLTSKLSGQDLNGVCGCGNCTVHTFLINGCPRPSQVPALSLPYADLSHLKDSQKVITLGRLYLEYQYMVSLFAQLKREIFFTITSAKVTFQQLSKTLVKMESFMPSLPQEDKAAEVKKAKSLTKLFSMLPDDSSFLEYHILEDLVAQLKSEKSASTLKAYKQELEQFCRRGIFECPLFSQAGKEGHSNFIVEMSRGRSRMMIQELVSVQEQLCSVLSVVSDTLNLCNVSKLQSGSIQIIFRVSNVVKDVLLPLSREHEATLRQLGCLDWTFYNGLDISYNPAQLANQLLSSGRVEESNHNAAGHTSNAAEMPKMDDISSEEEDDDESPSTKKLKPAPGKKTRGRVKIPMEYIKNKLRRYTTFSKRKSNIMKKAYELSTLTGTQVMLMVASETGHVYTFATPKLQPMITSEAGKALIQTCLHQPDPVQHNSEAPERRTRGRMSSSGYEETDLGTYIPPEDGQSKQDIAPPTSSMFPVTTCHGGGMLSMYNHPPPSLTGELLPSGILHSLVSTSSSSLLPPPLISPDGYSTGPAEDDLEPPLRDGQLGTCSPAP